jgi:uncharacterized membrane protein
MNHVLPILLAAAAAISLIPACQSTTTEQPETAPADWNVLDAKALKSSHGHVDFVTHVKPILEQKCVPCHSQTVYPMFSLESRQKAFEGGPLGKRIIPGDPNDSALVFHIASTHRSIQVMPPVGNRLTADEIRILTAWVKQGAEWPRGKAGNLSPRYVPEP